MVHINAARKAPLGQYKLNEFTFEGNSYLELPKQLRASISKQNQVSCLALNATNGFGVHLKKA
jgi:hypothetical protein